MPGSKERKEIEAELKRMSDNVEDVPIIIGNEKFKTKDVRYQVMVSNFGILYRYMYFLYNHTIQWLIQDFSSVNPIHFWMSS